MLQKDKRKKIFEMKVIDIFNFQDGRTLFSGELLEEIKLIRPCLANIVIDGQCVDSIQIEGSWMPGKKELENPLFRTVSTCKTINKNQLPYKNGKVILIGYEL